MRDNSQLQQDDLPIWLALKYKFERLHVVTTSCSPSAVRLRDQDDPHDDAHLEGEDSAKRQKTSEHETFVFEESSSGQYFKSKPCASMSTQKVNLTAPTITFPGIEKYKFLGERPEKLTLVDLLCVKWLRFNRAGRGVNCNALYKKCGVLCHLLVKTINAWKKCGAQIQKCVVLQ
nr:hypothetical protein [Tanacetum cinerariifolium]